MKTRLESVSAAWFSLCILTFCFADAGIREMRAAQFQRWMDGSARNGAPTRPGNAPLLIDTTTNTQRLFQGIARDPLPPSVTLGAMTRFGQRTQSGLYRGMPALAGNALEDGIVFSTGNVNQINDLDSRITSPALNRMEGTPTAGFQREDIIRIARETSRSELPLEDYKIYDAANFKVEFTTTADIKSFSVDFVYGSDEFPTYLKSDFNDVFVILLDGKNIAFDSDLRAISVANNFFRVPNVTVEGFGDDLVPGDEYFVPELMINGFTPPLRAQANLAAGKHTLEFALVDISDALFNSAVFLTNLRFNTTTVIPGTQVRVDFINDQAFTVPETLLPGSEVGVVATLLPRDSLALSLLAGHPALAFDAATGRLTVAPGQSLTPYRDQTLTLQVVARKQTQADTAKVEVRVTAVPPDPPKDLIQDQTFSVLETLPPGGEVGVLATLVPKDSLTLSLLTGPAPLVLDAAGRLTVAPGQSLAPFRGQTLLYEVVAKKQGQADTARVTVRVTAVAPPLVSATRAVYFDADGDGRIDQAHLEFAAAPLRSPERVRLGDPFAAPATIEVAGAALAPLDAARFRLDFPAQEFAFGTGFATADLGALLAPDSVFDTRPFPVEDGVGPLPTFAEAIGPQQLGDKPTLTLLFSEPVKLDPATKAFPYHVKRPGKDQLGPMVVESIRDLGGNRFLYTFSSPEFPLPGDSLQAITDNPHLTDALGNKVRMSYFIPVVGKHPVPPLVLQVTGPAVVTYPPLANLVRLTNPMLVEAVLQPGSCVGCQDPQRGAALQQVAGGKPIGQALPFLMQVKTSGPIQYSLRFFSNRGEFVNAAQGKVDEAALRALPKDAEGNYLFNLYWWPVSARGEMTGTGAYIMRGSLLGDGQVDTRVPQQAGFSHMPNRPGNVSVTFGFIRR